MIFSNINKEYIRTHEFVCDGITFPDEKDKVSYRLSVGGSRGKKWKEQQIKLRQEFSNIFFTRFEGNYAKLHTRTGISEDSMRKYLRGVSDHKITRVAIGKLCVGINLSIDESNELFKLEGHSLEPENKLLDAIVVDALQCGDDIDDFIETCKEFKIRV